MTEPDKFQRRLIRSVARLRLGEKQMPDAMWATLLKETGRNCKEIWNHMRILTITKLSRLLAADDYVDKLKKVARMTLTDWLLFDMVLVHEQIDVITADKSVNASELTALEDLFELVQHFKIETMSADPNSRAEAWAALVLKYNETGRECSPMLLQLRWHQLKKTSREKHYQFWQVIRGNPPNLLMAQQQLEPTPLQMAIAKRFTYLITEPFESWEELIQEKKVILLEHFIVLKRSKKSAINEARNPKPDIVVLEPQMETITLAEGSDGEDSISNTLKPVTPKQNTTQTNESLVDPINEVESALVDIIDKRTQGEKAIKGQKEQMEKRQISQSPEIDGLLNVEIISVVHVPTEEIDEPSDDHETDPVTKQLQPFNNNRNAVTKATLVKSEIDRFIEENAVINEEAPYIDKQLEELEDTNITNTENSVVNDLENMNDPVIRIYFDSSSDVNIEIKESEPIDKTSIDSSDTVRELPSNLKYLDDGIDMDKQYEDDVFEYDNENETQPDLAEESTSSDVNCTETEISCDNPDSTDCDGDKDVTQPPKFDPKLMMLTVVYTTKLDHMKMFQDQDFKAVQTADLINKIYAESKPFNTKSGIIKREVKVEPVENQVFVMTTKEKTVDDDLKMLAPGTDEDIIFTDTGMNNKTKMEIQKKTLITQEKINEEDIKISPENEEEYESIEEKICEEHKVKPNLYMFKKPRTRNYTPMQLCKNPDFNTRLKKLSIGFLTAQRNRQLLTACKPLTVDLPKAFESKLVDNTIYFKSSLSLKMQQTIKEETSSKEHLVSFTPSTRVDIEDLLPANKNQEDELLIAERNKNKVINLPDIKKVRRLNQHLATAEVSPIQVNTGMSEISCLVSSQSAQSKICADDQIVMVITPQQLKNELVAKETEALQSGAPEPDNEKRADDNFDVDVVNTDFNESEDECCYGDGDAYYIQKRKRGFCVQKFREYIEMHEKPPPLVTCLNPESVKEILDLANKTSKSNKKSLQDKSKPQIPWYVRPKIPKQRQQSDSKVVTKNTGESLSTSDALNKMLTLLNGSQVKGVNGNSNKNVKKAQPMNKRKLSATKVIDLVDKQKDIDKKKADLQKAVQSIVMPPPVVLLNAEPVVTKVKPRVRVRNKPHKYPRSTKQEKYSNSKPPFPTSPQGTLCCWAREKIMTLETEPTKENNTKMHRCIVEKRLCVCCCIKDLFEFKFRTTAISDICCWARAKLTNLTVDGNAVEFLKPHRCVIECRKCDCCCMKDLVLYQILNPFIPSIAGINRPSPRPGPSKNLSNTITEIESVVNVLSDGSPEAQTVQSNVPCLTVIHNTILDFLPKPTNPTGLPSDPEKDANDGLNDCAQIHPEENIENGKGSSANFSTELNKSADSEQLILLSDNDNDNNKTIVDEEKYLYKKDGKESSANFSTELNKSGDSEQFILLSDDDNDNDSDKTIVDKEKELYEREAELQKAVQRIAIPPRSCIIDKYCSPKKLKLPTFPKGTLCCWAREKIIMLEKDPRKENNTKMHRCTAENRVCVCCCLKDLLKLTLKLRVILSNDCCRAREKLINLKLFGNTEKLLKPHRCAIECRQCDCCCVKELVSFETGDVPIIVGINRPSPKPSPSKNISNTINEIESAINVSTDVNKSALVLLNEEPVVTKGKPKVRVRNKPPRTSKKVKCSSHRLVCCWARDKILKLEMDPREENDTKMHRCTVENRQCVCCCINDLLEFKSTATCDDCCWARGKLTNLKLNRNTEEFSMPHVCAVESRRCDCCCINDLVLFETEHLPLIVGINTPSPRPSPITKVLSDGNSETQRVETNVSYVTAVLNTKLDFAPKITNPTGLPSDPEKYANGRLNDDAEIHIEANIETGNESSANASTELNKSADSEQFILLSDDDNDSDENKTVFRDTRSNQDKGLVNGPTNYQQMACLPVTEKKENIIESTKEVLQTPKACVTQHIKILSKTHNLSNVYQPENVYTQSVGSQKSTLESKVWKEMYIIKCAKSQSTCPINMGEGNILLTNAKIPIELLNPEIDARGSNTDNTNSVTPKSLQSLLPCISIPGSPLPKGVSLVLTPNGVSFITEPDIQLDSSLLLELEGMVENLPIQLRGSVPISVPIGQGEASIILNEVNTGYTKKSLNETSVEGTKSAPTVKSTRKIDRDDKQTGADTLQAMIATAASEEAELYPVLSQGINGKSDGNTEKSERVITHNDQCDELSDLEVEKYKPCSDNVVASVSEKRSADLEKKKLIENHQESEQESNKPENQDKEGRFIKKNDTNELETKNIRIPESTKSEPIENMYNDEAHNLISEELRDQEGINNEDKPPSDQSIEIKNNLVSAKKWILSNLMVMSGISPKDVPPAPEPNLKSNFNPALSGPNIQELTQVTTLAVLKYAHQHNARFIKYDVVNGVMVTIQVSIEEVQKNSAPAVIEADIDLTDDLQPADSRVQVLKPNRPLICRKRAKLNNLKELEALFQQRKKKAKLESRSLLGQNVEPTVSETSNRRSDLDFETIIQTSYISTKKNRKPNQKTDSDEPMEEELLVSSSSNSKIEKDLKTSREKYTNNESGQKRPLEVSELDVNSSDGERLVKKWFALKR